MKEMIKNQNDEDIVQKINKAEKEAIFAMVAFVIWCISSMGCGFFISAFIVGLFMPVSFYGMVSAIILFVISFCVFCVYLSRSKRW